MKQSKQNERKGKEEAVGRRVFVDGAHDLENLTGYGIVVDYYEGRMAGGNPVPYDVRLFNSGGGLQGTVFADEDVIEVMASEVEFLVCDDCGTEKKVWHDGRGEYFCPFCYDE